MLGYIAYQENSTDKAYMRQEKRHGGSFLVLDMGHSARGMFAPHRAASAAKQMRAQGVRRAVFPFDFPHTAVFLRHGIAPVDTLPLQRALCVPYVRKKLSGMGLSGTQAVIAVVGTSVGEVLAQTVRDLSRSYRYVLLSVSSGGDAFAAEMRRQYGISLLLQPSADQLARSDALILFSPTDSPVRNDRLICALYPGASPHHRIPLQPGFREGIPSNCPPDQLASALHSQGILPAEHFLGEITC